MSTMRSDLPPPATDVPVEGDPFASFMALRPKLEPPPQDQGQQLEATVEQSLREDVLRTKKQLLEIAVQAEFAALDPRSPADTKAKLRRIRRAQKYLKHPEQILDAMSDTGSEASEENRVEEWHSELGDELKSLPSNDMTIKDMLEQPPVKPPPESTLSVDQTLRPETEVKPATLVQKLNELLADEPLLTGWYTKNRCFNIEMGKKDLQAKRRNTAMPGACVVIGDGKVPLFNGSHLLCSGYYYAFHIDAVDENSKATKNLSLGFGFSRYPARDKDCKHPLYAYEIPETVLVGYGSRLIDGKRWQNTTNAQTNWDSQGLQVNDTIGVLASPQGELIVYVNSEQKLRVPTTLAEDARPEAGKPVRRVLFPIIDLHGRVSAVTLLPRAAPPNKPLETRSRLSA